MQIQTNNPINFRCIQNKNNLVTKNNINVSKSLYNLANQIGANYFRPSFGMNNPHLAMLRAQKIKTEYAKAGINYLLPNEVWTTKKVMQAVDKAAEGYSKLLRSDIDFTKQDLKNILYDVLPEKIAEKIIIQDYKKDFPKYLRANGYSEKQIEEKVKSAEAITINDDNNNVLIFFNTSKSDNGVENTNSKNTFVHELKHAITSLTTNIQNYDLYNILRKNTDYCKIFYDIESTYRIDKDVSFLPKELTKENLLKHISNTTTETHFKNEDEFKKDLLNLFKLDYEVYIGEKPITEKNIKKACKIMQHYAKDEKEAYSFLKVFRIYNKKEPKSFGIELNSLKYAFFEKFFRELGKNPKIIKEGLSENNFNINIK